MKYVYFIIIFIIVLFLSFRFIPIIFSLLNILIGIGLIGVFCLGFWLGKIFFKKYK